MSLIGRHLILEIHMIGRNLSSASTSERLRTVKYSSGDQIHRSASAPTLITPFFPYKPTCFAVPTDIHLTKSWNLIPLAFPSVHNTLSPNPMVAIPPHAPMKSPWADILRSGVQGL